MNKLIKKIIGILTLAVVFVAPVFAEQGASAASSEDLYKKVLINNMYYCYNNALVTKIAASDYANFNSLMNEGFKNGKDGASSVAIPTLGGSFNKNRSSGLSCYDAFNGNSSNWGIFKFYNKSKAPENNYNTAVLTDFMRDTMAYTVDTNSGGASNIEYCYTVYGRKKQTTALREELGKACASEDNFPLNSGSMTFGGGADGSGYTVIGGVRVGNDESLIFDVTVRETGGESCYDDNGNPTRCEAKANLGAEKPDLNNSNAVKRIDLVGNLRDTEIYVEVTKGSNDSGAENSRKVSYSRGTPTEFIQKITGEEGEHYFTEADKYDLYIKYLEQNWNNGQSVSSTACQAERPSALVDVYNNNYYIFVKNSGWCLATLSEDLIKNVQNVTMTVFPPGKENNLTLNHTISTLPQLINLLGQLDYSDTSMFEDISQGTSGTIEQPKEDEDKCFSNAGALGWVLCPVTSGLAKLGSSAYKWIEENFLQIKASIFNDNTYGVQNAWGTIRNLANIGFIIMLLVVVFSQITGVGIDNYGIKRILPKIIIGAIIMNLSYIICELSIDVSNIFGSGLNDLLSNMGPSFAGLSYDASSEQYLIVGGTGVLAAAGYLILTSGGLGAILMLFIAILTVAISILVLFVILIIRQAGIVICVVVAPIAVLCYLLPNTEKVFKKWWELMKGLLLVYPLCGLVIGAGNFIGRVFGTLAVGDSGNMQMGFALSAMVVQVIPYLFIPMLLRSSLAAMGNLGARISGFGSRFSGGIGRRVRSSDMMKSSQELASERRTRFRAGIGSDGKPIKDISAFGKFMRGGKRGMARAANQYLKDEAVRRRGENLLNGVGLDAAIIGQQKQAEKNEMQDYMTLINNETRNGEDDKKLNELYDTYMRDGNKAGAVAVARIAGRRKDTASSFMKRNVVEEDAASKYDPKLMSSVMKEITTGENSGMYRSSNPLGFEFAAQYNRNYKEQYGDNDTRPEVKYSAWRNKDNVSQALNNYVTNSQELVGMKNSSLEEINKLMADGMVDETVARRIRQLANETIDNRGKTGVWDSTKADNIYAMAGRAVGDDRRNGGDSGTIQIVSEGGFNNAMNDLRNERGGLASGQPSNNPNNQPNNNSNNSDGSIIIPGRR